ncbi:MAG: MBL fold metallo-hydrolase [Nibricoccus sp.]
MLVDAGFSARKTAQLLATVGESLDRIDAIFITHEHGDHAAIVSGLEPPPSHQSLRQRRDLARPPG